ATLAYIIETRERRLALKEIAHLGIHLCSAVHYLHRHGILHLDLKPSNVVSERGLARILDLSIAHPPGKTRKGAGTANYMAPEQARGDLVGPPTDVWGIGAVLFEAATGELPFDGFDEEDRYEQLERRAERVRQFRRVPKEFDALVAHCLDPDPARRPTVAGLMKTLAGFVQD
ncbi:MAG: serine/threonine-protein kinase, partial [Actinomycetota bacterium]